MASLAGNDATIGPQYRGPGGARLDFTLKFLDLVLQILPTALFIVLAAVLAVSYRRRSVCVKPGPLLWTKQSAAVLLFCVEIANAALWGTAPTLRVDTSLPAAALSAIAAVSIGVTLSYGHCRNLRSPALVSIYLTVSLLFDVVKSRAYFLRPGYNVFASLSVATGVLKLLLLILEEIPKTSRFVPGPHLTSGSEARSGYWNRTLYVWLNQTLLHGFRKILTVDELENLGAEFASEYLVSVFLKKWNTANKTSRYCLALSSAMTLLVPCVIITMPRLIFSSFIFSQPFLLRRMMQYVGQEDAPESTGNALVAATVVIFVGIALTRASYKHMTCRFIVRLRGALTSAIFHKTLALRADQAEKSESMTLMSTDIEGIVTGIPLFYDACAAVIELSLGLYLLSTVVDQAAFLAIFPICVSTVLATFIGKKTGPARATWNKFIETRVAKTADSLANVKGIKMLGLETRATQFIQRLRIEEVNSSKPFRILAAMTSATAMFFYAITPVIVIAGVLFWTDTFKGKLNAVDTFTALAFILLIQVPLVILLRAYPNFTATMASFSRIQAYLLHDEAQDSRLHTNELPVEDLAVEKEPKAGGADETTTPSPESCVVKFSDVTLSYDGEKRLVDHCNFSINRCELAMFAGQVGSGKSTILQGILGEVAPTHGTIYVDKGVIAYCGQVPWLPNMSIRDIITGGSGDFFDPVWYGEVVSGCLLVDDLRRLPGGDQFRVGSGGVKLSGGQKHRVALARALYLRAATIVLDDILSALDQQTRTAILSRVCGEEGLIRRCLSTVIMTTHSVECLRHANKILFLNGEGNITMSSNVEDLLKRDDFQRLISRGLIVNEKKSDSDTEGSSLDAMTASQPAQETQFRGPKPAKDDFESILLKGDSTLYLFYFKSIGKRLFTLWVIVMFFVTFTERFPEIYVRIWLDVDPEDMRFFIGYASLGIGSSIFTLLNHALYYLNLVPESCENLHELLIEATMGATMSFLTQTDTGSLLNRFSQDMNLLSQNLPAAMFKFLYMTFIVMIDVVIIATTAKYAAIIIPFLLIGLYVIQMFYLRTSRQMRHLDLEAKSPLYTQLNEIIAGLHHIRSLCWVDDYLKKSYTLLDYSQKPFYYMYCIQQWLSLTLDCCSIAISTALALIAVHYKGSTTQAAIGLGFINMITFSLGMSMLVESWVNLETCLGAIARLRKFLKTTPQESGPDADSSTISASWPEHGDITISNLTASYRVESARHVALDDVSVAIQGGMKVGIIGRTGSGKSSLLLTLLNFLEYSGSIKIDGVEISDVPLQVLRSRITTITQDYVELHGAIRDNLFPHSGGHSESISDDVAVDALKKVGLWERVTSSGGLDATLNELGLSQGEKQLLSIARAFLHHKETGSKVILVDEATSSMDQDTDRNVQALMRDMFEGSTILMVAHRHETIQDASLLVELADGKVADVSELGNAADEEEAA